MASSNKSSLPCVLGMGTANPERIVYMKDFARKYGKAVGAPPAIQELANRICKFEFPKRFHIILVYLWKFTML